MRHADIGDDADIGACDGGEAAHLSEVIHSHLKDSRLMIFLEPEDGDRKSPFIVEVSLCFVDVVFLRDHGGDHFLCTGLSDAACNAHNFDVEGVPIELGDVKKRLAGGFYQYIRMIRLSQIFMGYHAERACLHCVRDELVGVDSGSIDGDEEIAGFYLAAVDGYAVHFPVKEVCAAVIDPLTGVRNIL